ncbi:ribonuclease P protein component [Geminicoccaceae bacterium 1502E]|nr:ribonuclease P protein component [Geminicoccaceae bacterium 1502E]
MVRLLKRAEFLAAARGARWNTPAFLLQCVERGAPRDEEVAGVGFTATRKLGSAVIRNRAKRRLREAVRLAAHEVASPGRDYVLVARTPVLKCPFDKLLEDVRQSFAGAERKLRKSRA